MVESVLGIERFTHCLPKLWAIFRNRKRSRSRPNKCSNTINEFNDNNNNMNNNLNEDINIYIGDDEIKKHGESLKSENSLEKCHIDFQNCSSEKIKISWFDYDGNIRDYMDNLEPGGTCGSNTFRTHPWLLEVGDDLKYQYAVVVRPSNGSSKVKNIRIKIQQSKEILVEDIKTKDNIIVQCNIEYIAHDIHGFKVFVDPSVSEDVLLALHEDLMKIATTVDSAPLKLLQSIRIYVNTKIRFGSESEADTWHGACFHPDAQWLIDHGNLKEKAEAVELYTTEEYLTRRTPYRQIHFTSNWMLHHELAHAYHFKLNKFEPSDIDSVYQKNITKGLYNDVAHISGKRYKAYATTNAKEYFASISASYFAYNDYAPFDRDELESFDNEGYQLMQKYWHLNEEQILEINPKLSSIF